MAARRKSRSRYSVKKRSSRKIAAAGSVKPLIFIIVIALSLAMRYASSGPLCRARERLSEVIAGNTDLEKAAETLGRVFSGKDDGDDNAMLVFGRLILGLEDKADVDADAGEQPTSGVLFGNMAGDSRAGDISGLAFGISESPPPREETYDDIGFDEEEEYDGTPNEAFRIPSPDIVDDNIYQPGYTFRLPLKSYRITSPYGYRVHPISGNTTFHYGVDMAASSGTKVTAAAAGTVAETGFGNINGNYVKISHEGGFLTNYAHLSKISVKKGQSVKAGQQIGLVGSTGYSTGPHLHFEVRHNGYVQDPNGYFTF